MVGDGKFREDLYYRLNVFPIELPPLRERRGDIGILADAFAQRFAKSMGRSVVPLTMDQISRLEAYRWPGNVRELQNVIERAVITARGGVVNLDRALPESRYAVAAAGNNPQASSQRVLSAKELEDLERKNLIAALNASRWKVAGANGAAALLGIKPTTLSSRMKALRIARAVDNTTHENSLSTGTRFRK
jgi:transcriptional regulator with GAF, ATPase, and Fis domain